MSIPDEVASIEDQSAQLPNEMAEIQEPEDDPEIQPLLLSFAKYNKKMCQLSDGMQKSQCKKALEILKKVGMEAYTADDLPKLGCTIKDVEYKGDYRDLFKGLHEDVDLQEMYIDSNGRMFYFLVDKILHLIAIRGTHLDTTKS